MGTGSKENIVAIITTRSKSTRFPDKFKADICGKPMLSWIVESAKQSKVDSVVVATVEGDANVIQFCEERGFDYYAGSENDILDRIYQAASINKTDLIVRVWGDSPLITANDINMAVDLFVRRKPPYLCRYSKNGAVSVMTMKELATLHNVLTDAHDREWIHNYQSEQKGAITIELGTPRTVDTIQDLEEVANVLSQRNN